jgi:hypothetical protein
MPIDPRNFEVLDDEMAAVFRTMSGAQRLKIASDLARDLESERLDASTGGRRNDYAPRLPAVLAALVGPGAFVGRLCVGATVGWLGQD